MRVARACAWLMMGGLVGGAIHEARAQDPTGVVAQNTRQETFQFGRFGTVHMLIPTQIKQVALFAGGDGGWNPGVNDMAQLLANQGTLVAGIDTVAYLQAANNGRDRCLYLAEDFENLAHAVEKRYRLKTYLLPVLSGYSSGATLAYAALAQAPLGTFKGALGLGFCKDIDVTRQVCRGRGLGTTPRANPPGMFFKPMPDLSEPMTILQGEADQACPLAGVKDFTRQIPSAKVLALPKVGHGFSVGRRWHDQYQAAHQEMQRVTVAQTLPADVGDLPLIEVPAAPDRNSNTVAVLLTGDGGWAGLDRELAARLAGSGIPVAALSSLKYFWSARSAAGVAKDVARIIDHYTRRWQRQRVLLVGYSFGADVLPAIVNQLDASTRARVAAVALIGLQPDASFEIRVAGWLGKSSGEPVLPQLQKLATAQIPVLCIVGDDEPDSLCRSLSPTLAQVRKLPGGHHYNGDYAALAKSILSFR